MATATRTLLPHETAQQLAAADSDDQLDRVVGSVMRQGYKELKKGGTRGLWAAIILLAAALGVVGGGVALHVQGDGTVREEARTTKVLVVWLVRCEHARQRGEAPPPFPLEDL
jgi:hypothetical protein